MKVLHAWWHLLVTLTTHHLILQFHGCSCRLANILHFVFSVNPLNENFHSCYSFLGLSFHGNFSFNHLFFLYIYTLQCKWEMSLVSNGARRNRKWSSFVGVCFTRGKHCCGEKSMCPEHREQARLYITSTSCLLQQHANHIMPVIDKVRISSYS